MFELVMALLLQAPTKVPSSAQQNDITVTARKENRRIGSLVKMLVTNADGQQLSRFEASICPGVVGGRVQFAETVLRLVRQNMAEAGAKVQPEGCKTTALIVFTTEPGGLMRALFARRRSLSRHVDVFRRDQLQNGDAAIRSFQLVGRRPANGASIDADFIAPPVIRNAMASRIILPTRLDTYFALAILDSRRVAGKTIQQLADIATLHLMLNINPDAAERVDESILSLFVREPAPPSLTALDRGMLKGLYGPNRNSVPASIKRGQIAAAVRRERERDGERDTP